MSKKQALVTRESLAAMLQNANRVDKGRIVGRALVGIFKRQTAVEQSANETEEHNNIGFASCDAKGGSLTAKSFLLHHSLTDWQLEKWTRIEARTGLPRICRYARQLNEIAIERANRRVVAAQLSLTE